MNTRKVVEISVDQANSTLTNYHFNRMKDPSCLLHLIQRGGFPNPTYRMSGESVAVELREIAKHSPSAFHSALTEAINNQLDEDTDVIGVRISPNKIYVLFDKNMPLTEEIKDEDEENWEEVDEDEDEDDDEDDEEWGDEEDEEDLQSLLDADAGDDDYHPSKKWIKDVLNQAKNKLK
jgi:hypothetical protein